MLIATNTLAKLAKIEAPYFALCFEHVTDVPVEMCQTTEHLRSEPGRRAGLKWQPAKRGTGWGGDWMTAWFRGDVKLPKACAGRRVYVRADTGGVETLFLVDGESRGMFGSNHSVVMMANRGAAGRKYHLAFEAYAGHPCVGFSPYVPGDESPGPVTGQNTRSFSGISIVLAREDVMAFVMDFMVLRSLAESLDENSLRRNQVLAGLTEVFAAVDAIPQETGETSWRPKLLEARKIMKPLLAATNGTTAPLMGLTGHSHLDTAWLWTINESQRKCARTFSAMLNLMEQYPEFVFLQPASYHTEIVQREYPDVYRRMKKMVRAGRWEPNGGLYVEPDCNVPSGESLVRQCLIGQNLTRQMFGYTSDTLWLPDVFGYSAAMPQILRGCGIEYFCTTKLASNDTTRFPYDTFEWRGIDGTSVIAHFNMMHFSPSPEELIKQWDWVQHKDVQDRRLIAFGLGDGGGGPGWQDLEMARRVEDLQGCPRTRYMSLTQFMQSVRDEMPHLPVWQGELYYESHRGTLTSIAKVKRGNRKSELALREAEFLATLAALGGAGYPQQQLLATWKTLAVNQFHDILPGTSIDPVNDRAVAELNKCQRDAADVCDKALNSMVSKPRGKVSKRLVVNSLSWDRTGPLAIPDAPKGTIAADPAVRSQWIEDVTGQRKLLVDGLTVPALGSAVLNLKTGRSATESPFKVSDRSLRTPFAEVRFDKIGRIRSMIDKTSGRQLVADGGALNSFWISQDVPEDWDNWNIDGDYELKTQLDDRLIKRRVVNAGPLQVRVRSTYRIGSESTLTQDMVFHATTPRVDFETVVDWAEVHKLLKAGFEFDLLSDHARHEIQYGHVERPTHRNLPQDRARFEVCCHKWTDLSENGFGVALLNDCKYGISVHGSDLRLTLMKSGTHPDSRGDKGRHLFAYAMLPHAGGFSVESVVRPAYEFNVVPTTTATRADVSLGPPLVVDHPNVIVESIKWAEKGRAFIARLYEAGKTGVHANVTFTEKVKSVTETNMLEENSRPLSMKNQSTTLYFKPFEIKTLRCVV